MKDGFGKELLREVGRLAGVYNTAVFGALGFFVVKDLFDAIKENRDIKRKCWAEYTHYRGKGW